MRHRARIVILTASLTLLYAADWPTDGGNPQRTNWQKDETILNKDNAGQLQLLWKVQLDNKPREMHSLFPPLIVSRVETAQGPKQIALEAGVSDNLYALDAATGQILWKRHFEYPPPTRNGRPDDPLCPGGQTATPVIGPPDAAGSRIVYAMDGSGALHQVNLASGEELIPPVPFGYPSGKSYALNLWKRVVVTTTSQGCAGNPNQMWAIDLDDPAPKVTVFNPKGGGLWGRQGASIDSTGIAWSTVGDRAYDPATQLYGNSVIGARMEDGALKLKDWYVPTDWEWMDKRDLNLNVSPAIFVHKGRELMVTSSKECRIYLLDTKSAGGENHQTPLARTPLVCNEEANFASAGVWGSMATWEDSKGVRWVLAPFWGAPHPDFKTPVSYGPVRHGAIVAFKLEEKSGKFQLTPAWISRDMDRAEPPVVANGVVYAYGSGENTTQAYPESGLRDSSALRIAASGHAVLYALDAETGRELYSSGDTIASFGHFSGLSMANGHVYLGTFDSILYCFGLPGK